MKRISKRVCALALALSLLAAAGCTGNGNPKATQPAMGRYVETELTLPADFALVSGMRSTEDGTLELLGYPKPPDGPGPIYLHLYRSADGGKSWTEETPAWLDFFNSEESAYGINSVAWAADGTLWFYIESQGDWTYALARLEVDRVTILDWEVPSASDGSGMRSFRVAENGDLILDCVNEFLQVDPATGQVKNIYTAPVGEGGNWNDGWAVNGNVLAVSEQSRIVQYDITTGKVRASLPCQGTSLYTYDTGIYYRLFDFGPDGNLYFCDAKGIYRTVEGNDTLEQLADGSLLSISTPSVRMQRLVALKDQFLILAWVNDAWKVFSYVYDPNTPTLPDTELAVWSLNDDPLVSQAISTLQKNNPGVHVTYTVGMPEDGSVTRDDAIRAINTQLLAGKGPDILVLDGLPYESYIEKDVLADIGVQLKTLDDSGVLVSNIANAYRQEDGKAYAVPAQFQVPMLHGSDDAMRSIRDLKTMADWLASAKGSFRTPFLNTKAKNILRILYPVCVDTVAGPDGGMDEAKLKDFLTQMKRILDLRTEVDESDEHNDWADSIDFNFGPLGWMAGNNALDLGNLSTFPGLYSAWTASDKRGDGSIDTLFGANAYLPVTSLGISAQSKQQELAWRFIETALSDEVQRQGVGKGMPVSLSAFTASTEQTNVRDDGVYSTYGTTFYDADGAQMPVNLVVMYPPEEYRNQMVKQLKSLDTPIFYDETVLQIIIEDSADFWSGKANLDATVNAIMQKLKLYEAE